MSSRPVLTIRPTWRPTEIVVEAELLEETVQKAFIEPAIRAWDYMIRDLAYMARLIMIDELPIGDRERGVHIRDTVVAEKISDDEWWIHPTKTVGGIPLGLILETGSAGGTVIVPVTKEALHFFAHGKEIFTRQVHRGVTKPNRYSQRTLERLGQVAWIEDRFWHHYSRMPEVIAAASGAPVGETE